MAGKAWTEEEIKFLTDGISNGLTCPEIATQLNRTVRSVQHKFNLLGLEKPHPKVGDMCGSYTIVEIFSEFTGLQNRSMARVRCECGNETVRPLKDIKNKDFINCVCSFKRDSIPIKPGDKFGRLTVLSLKRENGWDRTKAECQCECGSTLILDFNKLRSGNTKSCGCYRKDYLREKSLTHGQSNSLLYGTWQNIKGRTQNPNNQDFSYYGGRGIKLCDEWLDFQNFHDWAMSNGYEEGLTIDRIDVDKDYSPDNCRWVDRKVQANNRRVRRDAVNPVIEAFGQSKTLDEWMKDPAIVYKNKYNLIYRIKAGWSPEEAMMTP